MDFQAAALRHPEGLDATDPVIVVFDLETTGLIRGNDIPHITQIAAQDLSGRHRYDTFVYPKRDINPQAQAVTGIECRNSIMRFKGNVVPHKHIKVALSELIEFLEQFGKTVIMVAHNCHKFDAIVLANALNLTDRFADFRRVVPAFSDTLQIFKKRIPGLRSYAQVAVASHVLRRGYNAHEAVADTRVLCDIINRVPRIVKEDFILGAISVDSFSRY